MPRLDDPKIKLKTGKPFKRKGLRPWDNPDEFKPGILLHQNIQNELVTSNEPISNQLVNTHKKNEKNAKPTTNDQLVTNKGSISNQLVTNKGSISNQLVTNKGSISNQESNQLVTAETPYSEVLEVIDSLHGIQKNLLIYITESCRSNAMLCTKKITSDELSIVLNTTNNTVKTATQRLINKGLVLRKNGKRGKGGYIVFSITEVVKNGTDAHAKKTLISNQESNQLGFNKVTSRLLSSSSNNINTTTDLGINPGDEMSVDWQTIDFSVLADIGFNKTHLAQLYKAGTQDPKMVQDSIYHFAFDLKHNGKKSGIKGDVLNFFMGIISKRSYTAPTNYINPDVEAMNAYLKTKEQEQKQKEELELKTQDLEFNHWHETLSDEEINELVSGDTKTAGIPKQLQQTLKMNQLKKHFKNFVWPDVKRKILNSTPNWKNA